MLLLHLQLLHQQGRGHLHVQQMLGLLLPGRKLHLLQLHLLLLQGGELHLLLLHLLLLPGGLPGRMLPQHLLLLQGGLPGRKLPQLVHLLHLLQAIGEHFMLQDRLEGRGQFPTR